jgi:hypothetical protein
MTVPEIKITAARNTKHNILFIFNPPLILIFCLFRKASAVDVEKVEQRSRRTQGTVTTEPTEASTDTEPFGSRLESRIQEIKVTGGT